MILKIFKFGRKSRKNKQKSYYKEDCDQQENFLKLLPPLSLLLSLTSTFSLLPTHSFTLTPSLFLTPTLSITLSQSHMFSHHSNFTFPLPSHTLSHHTLFSPTFSLPTRSHFHILTPTPTTLSPHELLNSLSPALSLQIPFNSNRFHFHLLSNPTVSFALSPTPTPTYFPFPTLIHSLTPIIHSHIFPPMLSPPLLPRSNYHFLTSTLIPFRSHYHFLSPTL